MSCVKALLKEPEENQALLKRIFQFFEKMAASEDEEVQSLLLCGTLESLDDTPQMLAEACVLMGPKTKMLWNRLQDFYVSSKGIAVPAEHKERLHLGSRYKCGRNASGRFLHSQKDWAYRRLFNLGKRLKG